jgi:replicative DNA helicase
MNPDHLQPEDFEFKDLDDKIILLREAKINPDGDKYQTGFATLNESLRGGVKNGDLVIISGRSGHGKTTWAQTLTYNFCREGIPCLWFSYEVSLKELDRKFREMKMEPYYEVTVPKKNTTGKIDWITEKIRESWVKFGTKIIFIDHIDFLVPKECRTSDNEQTTLKRITTELKQLAIELEVVIVTMAHIKKIEEGKDPGLYDIGYSAGIFQLADLVFMVDRERIKRRGLNANEGDLFTNNTIIKIVKNRETGILKFLKVNYANGRFCEIKPEPVPVKDFHDPDFGR